MTVTARQLVIGAVVSTLTVGAVLVLWRPSTTMATDDQAARQRANVLRHEEAIATCMRGRGFDYVAAVPSDLIVEEARRAAEADGGDTAAAVRRAEADAPANPNKNLVAKLPESRQAAWGDALWGDETWEGCYNHTFQQAWGVNLDQEIALADELAAKVRADPAVIAAARRYVDCMASKGYEVATPDDVDAMVGRHNDGLDPAVATTYSKTAFATHRECVASYQRIFDSTQLRLSKR